MKRFGSCAVSILIIIVGCGPNDEDPVIHLSGIVQSQTTQIPIASAWVALRDSTLGVKAFTDSMGQFDLIVFPIVESKLFAGADGYLTFDTSLAQVTEDIDSFVIRLTPSP